MTVKRERPGMTESIKIVILCTLFFGPRDRRLEGVVCLERNALSYGFPRKPYHRLGHSLTSRPIAEVATGRVGEVSKRPVYSSTRQQQKTFS
jgi:hypothetical protein